MAKLFFTLYLMVIASFLVFLIFMEGLDVLSDSVGDGAIIDEEISIGTFRLLDKSLNGLDEAQTDQLINKYKKIFGDEFQLIELSTLDLDEEQKSALENGKVVSVSGPMINFVIGETPQESQNKEGDDEDIDILYFKRPNTSMVWRARLDYELDMSITNSSLAINVKGGKFAEGSVYMLQSQLEDRAPSEWTEILNKLEPEFGLPVKIIALNSLSKNLNLNEQLRIKQNKVANISQDTIYTTFVQKIPNSTKLLQVGPVEIPWLIRNFPILLVIAFILAFAFTILLWLWPLWSNLLRIKKAAEDFGAGNYNARVPNRKRSPVAKISKAFNSMAEQTQQSIRQQKELTTAVSHELRTPVARMRFALEMLDSSENKSDKSRYIGDINEDIDELDLLLEELLTYARFDQKSYSINPKLEKLIPWLSNSMEKLMPLAEKKILHYRVEGIGINETTLFEPRLMTRVLDNLVQNALRYAHQTVEVALCKDQDSYLLIVEDDGDGIPKDKHKNIFDAFSRIDASRDRASGGFGLGLAIVDRIVKAHLGNISVNDSTLGGARFEVRIPAKTLKESK